jgi:hypothetical protein
VLLGDVLVLNMRKILLLILVSPLLMGTTYRVAVDGSGDNTTIATANARAIYGDTVSLNRGDSWAEKLTCKSGVTYNNYGTGNLPIIVGGNDRIIFISSVNNVTVDGIKITDAGIQRKLLSLLVYNATDIIIRNCIADLNNNYVGWNFAANAVNTTAHDILIENNTILGGYEIGIQPYSDYSKTATYDITIRNNTVGNTSISAEYGAGHGINIGFNCSNVTVEKNYVFNSSNMGIVIDAGNSDVKVENNICYNNVRNIGAQYGATMMTNNISFYHNTLIYGPNTTTAGFYLYGSATLNNYTLKNNIVIGNNDSVGFIRDLCAANTITNFTSDYNCFYSVTGNATLFRFNNTNYTTLALWQATGRDTHSTNANPLLTSDYKLKFGSPAIGAGIDVGVKDDYRGLPRRADKTDIGCFLYGTIIRGNTPVRNVTFN